MVLVDFRSIYIGDHAGTGTTCDKSIRCITRQSGCYPKHRCTATLVVGSSFSQVMEDVQHPTEAEQA